MEEITFKPFKDIHLDYKNPRISEFIVDAKTSEDTLLSYLWTEMAVNELIISILANGFWKFEPLIVTLENDRFVVVEGNRRLAAVKIIQNPDVVNLPSSLRSKITDAVLSDTEQLPVIIVSSRQEAWKYIGFKHVNGPAKWGSFAKAKYIAEVHNEYGISIAEVANQIGDTNQTAQKLYQGLMVLEQAKKENVFDYADRSSDRIYFSHLYTGLQREGIKKFLGINDSKQEEKNPVPRDKFEELKLLLTWLYGNSKTGEKSIIKSQNPDLKYLDDVLKNREATLALKDGESLEYSYELSRANDALFEENLLLAKRSLQKARGYITSGYFGDDILLKHASVVAQLGDDLYNEMTRINRELETNTSKRKNTQ